MFTFNFYYLSSLFLVSFGVIFVSCHIRCVMFNFTTNVVFHLPLLQDLVWHIFHCILLSKSLFHLHFFTICFIVCICNNFNYNHSCCGMFILTTIAMFCFHCLQNLVQHVFHHVHVLTMFCNNMFFTLFFILFYAMDFYLYHTFLCSLCSPFYCALFKIIVSFLSFYVVYALDLTMSICCL